MSELQLCPLAPLTMCVCTGNPRHLPRGPCSLRLALRSGGCSTRLFCSLMGVLPPPGAAHWGQFYPPLRGGCEREVGLGRWVLSSQGHAFQGAERPQLPLPFKRLP